VSSCNAIFQNLLIHPNSAAHTRTHANTHTHTHTHLVRKHSCAYIGSLFVALEELINQRVLIIEYGDRCTALIVRSVGDESRAVPHQFVVRGIARSGAVDKKQLRSVEYLPAPHQPNDDDWLGLVRHGRGVANLGAIGNQVAQLKRVQMCSSYRSGP
jgi:hypothetical protein